MTKILRPKDLPEFPEGRDILVDECRESINTSIREFSDELASGGEIGIDFRQSLLWQSISDLLIQELIEAGWDAQFKEPDGQRPYILVKKARS